jgi:hypothetical protein
LISHREELIVFLDSISQLKQSVKIYKFIGHFMTYVSIVFDLRVPFEGFKLRLGFFHLFFCLIALFQQFGDNFVLSDPLVDFLLLKLQFVDLLNLET